MAKQRFLNNFTSTFIAAVKDAPSSGTPETELDYGVLRISDGAAGSLINPTGGDYYLLTAFKRSGSVESNIEVMRVTGVNNATPGECRITVERAQEGTSAKAFVAGDYLSLRITKGTAENFSQPADLATKEPVIAAPGSAPTEKYWRGDKTWSDFFTDVRAATLTGLSTATNSPVVSTDTVLQAVGKLQAQVGSSAAGFRNKIINGGCENNQRGVVSATDDSYVGDRFYVLTESGAVTFAHVADPESGAPYGYRITQPDATAKRMGFVQIIEGRYIRPYALQAMNMSARIKLSSGAAVRYAVIEHTGTEDVVTSDVVNNWASTNFTAGNFFISGVNILKTGAVTPGAGSYGDISDWVVLGSGVKNVILFIWTESTMVQNGSLEFNRWAFEPGTIKTPFEWRMNELALCQRYFQALYGSGSGAALAARGAPGSGNALWLSLALPVEMRATPTAAVVGTWSVSNCPQPTISQAAKSNVTVFSNATGAGDTYFFSTSTAVGLTLSAEL